MRRPPLANLFALSTPDRARLEDIEADLRAGGEFRIVWRPAADWVAALAPLPDSAPDSDEVRREGLAFVEGRDVIASANAGNGRSAFRHIAELADVWPQRLDRLPGDFGFVRFRSNGAATIVRSCGGLVPFYVWRSIDGIAIATQLGRLIQYLPDEPRIDPLVLAVWTAGFGFFPDRRTFFKDVAIVDRGGFLTIAPRQPPRFGRYWDPRPGHLSYPTRAQRQDRIQQLRTCLLARLDRDLDPDGGNLLTLSGGVDSSTLGILSGQVLGRKLMTWSLVPSPETIQAQEMSYIAPLWESCAVGERWVVPLEAGTRMRLLERAPVVAFPILHPALCALPSILDTARVRVLVGGEFADEICGSAFTVPDWIQHTNLFRLLFSLHRLPTGPRDVLRWIRHRHRSRSRDPVLPCPSDLPAFVNREVRAEYVAWRNRWRAELASDRGPRRGLAIREAIDGFVPMNWEACSVLGVRRSFPFFAREILELGHQCHPAELIGPGTKKLLREAFRGDVPHRMLFRRDKGGRTDDFRGDGGHWNGVAPALLTPLFEPGYEPRSSTVTAPDAFRLAVLTHFAGNVASYRGRRRRFRCRGGDDERTDPGVTDPAIAGAAQTV